MLTEVKVGIPESFKVGWYPPKILGRVTLNFRYFNTNSKRKIHSNIKFFPERDKNGAKSQIIFFSISRNFRPFSDNSRFFRNISEDYQRCPKTGEAYLKRKLAIFDFIVVVIFIIMWTMQFYSDQKRFFSRKTLQNSKDLKIGQFNSKHKKLWVNNTNTKPHSDPPISINFLVQFSKKFK